MKVLACALSGFLALPLATAQTGDPWVEFKPHPAALDAGLQALVSSVSVDVDFAVGDLDRDGWPDVVAVRKGPGSSPVKQPNLLLMNEQGVLRDRTQEYAAAADLPGDQCFLTPTSDRDVEIADLDLDGWPDVVTAVSLSELAAKDLSHPRVYRNLGPGESGWLGLRYESTRIPQLIALSGAIVGPQFVDIGVGDVTGDGAPDLHFVDHDETNNGFSEKVANDFNDRLLINDGNGYFTDQSTQRMTAQQLTSEFGIGSEILDMNQDGVPEIVRGSSNGAPIDVFVEYNDPANPGDFKKFGEQSGLANTSPYSFTVGELNNDGLIDLVVQDDALDRYRLAQGIDALQRVVWGPLKTFTFVSGGDEGFGGNPYMHDLDGDGFQDVLICDFDVDVPGCGRHLRIYHNLGGPPGSSVVLREEAGTSDSVAWKGVVGMALADQAGTYDVALADFDRDGDQDMLVGRCAGTFFWQNQTDPLPVCQTDLGHGGPGNVTFSLCGGDLTQAGSTAVLEIGGAPSNAPIHLVLGLSANPIPALGGTLVPNPVALSLVLGSADANGAFSAIVPGVPGSPVKIYAQALVPAVGTVHFSNALEIVVGL